MNILKRIKIDFITIALKATSLVAIGAFLFNFLLWGQVQTQKRGHLQTQNPTRYKRCSLRLATSLRPLAFSEKEPDSTPGELQAPKTKGRSELIKRVNGILWRAALDASGGNVKSAADLLGIEKTSYYSNRKFVPDELNESWRKLLFKEGSQTELRVDIREAKKNILGMIYRAALDMTAENNLEAADLLKVSRTTIYNYREKIPAALSEEWQKVLFEEIIKERLIRAGANAFQTAVMDGVDIEVFYSSIFEYRTDVVGKPEYKPLPGVKEGLFFDKGRPVALDKFTGMLCRAALNTHHDNLTDAGGSLGVNRNTLSRYVKDGLPGGGRIPSTVNENFTELFFEGERLISIEQLKMILFRAALDAANQDEKEAGELLGVNKDTISRHKAEGLIPPRLSRKWKAALFETLAKPAPLDYEIAALIDWIQTKKIRHLSDARLKAKTHELRRAVLENGMTLNAILPEAFAVFREAAFREAAKRNKALLITTEQILTALAIHRGMAVEMLPGEGKTLAIAMAAYLNALTGKGVHIHTFNDYLAKRDGQNMGAIFDLLGLTTGVVVDSRSFIYGKEHNQRARWIRNLKARSKQDAYLCDVTYGEKDEFVFDYLRDNMIFDRSQQKQRENPPEITIVDEGDNALIDEASNPLIICLELNGLFEADYKKIYEFVDPGDPAVSPPVLVEGEDHEIREKEEDIIINPSARGKIEEFFYKIHRLRKMPYEMQSNMIRQALRAKLFYHSNQDYILKQGKVVIVDEFTGRLKTSHIWANHIQQFVETKEKVKISPNLVMSATITYQCYYRGMKRASGLSAVSGTIGADAKELMDVYGLSSIGIPLQHESLREDERPVVFEAMEVKNNIVESRIIEIHETGNPILVFVPNIEAVLYWRNRLSLKGIQCESIDGLNPQSEAGIIEAAGKVGKVTIATNAPGRGDHIEIEEGVEMMGGLCVVRTFENKNNRADLQQLGRTARRGKPGRTETYVSKEDELRKRFGNDEPQRNSEAYHRELRIKTFKFDEELSKNRDQYYGWRKEVLNSALDTDEKEQKLKAMDKLWSKLINELERVKYIGSFEGYRRALSEQFASLEYRVFYGEIGLGVLLKAAGSAPRLCTAIESEAESLEAVESAI